MTAPLSNATAHLLELAKAGQPRPAIAFARDLARNGLTFGHLVTDHIVPVQREVGRLWQEHGWSVADEHAATAVIDGVLGALALDIPDPLQPQGHALVACVEQEYHSMPARLGVELLRDAGWSVAFLGASVPEHDLQLYAATTSPDVVVLSCTFVEHLHNARRGVGGVADLGLPAVVAGAAITAHRAEWMGASGWIGPDDDPSEVLLRELAPAIRRDGRAPSAISLELDVEQIAAACMGQLFPVIEEMGRYSHAQLAATRGDLDHLLRHLILSLDLDEPSLLHDLVRWLEITLAARGVPPFVMPRSMAVLASVLDTAGHADAAATCRGAD